MEEDDMYDNMEKRDWCKENWCWNNFHCFFIKINLIPRLGLLVSMVSRQTEHGEQNMSGVESQWYNLDKHEIQAKEIDNKES